MKKVHFMIALVASLLLIVQAIVGIMLYANGSDTQEMSGSKMKRQTANSSTTSEASKDSTTDDSTKEASTENSTTTDESTTVPSSGGQGNMGTPPQGGPNGSGTPGEMLSGSGFPGGDSFSGNVINFYQGVGGLGTSIAVLITGGAGLVTSVMTRKFI